MRHPIPAAMLRGMQDDPRFHDIGRQGRRLVRWLAGFVAVEAIFAATGVDELARPSTVTMDGMPVPYLQASFASFVALVVVGVMVLRWIHHANANAQRLADGMSISPGWNVGWFFVPVANLFQPFTGMWETWAVSHDPQDWPAQPVPALLRWWWAAWQGFVLIGNLSSFATTFDQPEPNTGGIRLDIAASLSGIAAALLLIAIVRRVSAAQVRAIAAHRFG